VPDRATSSQPGAMVAALRWSSRAFAFCVALPILRTSIKTLNFSSGTVSLPPLSFPPRIPKRPLLDFGKPNLDEVIQLQV
jgi:hypothetical protein